MYSNAFNEAADSSGMKVDLDLEKIEKKYYFRDQQIWQTLKIIGLFLSPLISSWACINYLTEMSLFNSFVYFINAIFVGSRLRGIGNVMHECAHYSLFARRKLNLILGTTIAILDFTSFADYRSDHLSHHIYLGDCEKDRDFATRKNFGFEIELSCSSVFMHLSKVFTSQFYKIYLNRIIFSKADSAVVATGRIAWIFILALSLYFMGVLNFSLYILLPYITFYQWFRYFSDVIDHAGLTASDHKNLRSRNHIFNISFLNWFLFPRNDSYHLVHHLFPAIPSWKLNDVHDVLKNNISYLKLNHNLFLDSNIEGKK